MKVFIFGASGILGKELLNLLSKKNIQVIGTYFNNPLDKCFYNDFEDVEHENNIEELLIKEKITVCVNCIVERQVDICEIDWKKIKKTNIDITNKISKICSKNNIHLTHISTDYVFDGLNPPYNYNSIPNPLQNYGISKLISEYRVLNNCKDFCIIRVPVLYTDKITNLDNTAVTLIGKKVLNRIEVFKEDNYSIRRPNYIPNFCNFILDCILDKRIGIFHFYNPNDKITKYQISNIISKILNKKSNIIPIDSPPNDGVERPLDTQLIDTKYDINQYSFTPLELGLFKCFQKVYHPKLNDTETNFRDLFFLIDLDGTLIDTDFIHYKCYLETLSYLYNYTIEEKEYREACKSGLDNFLKNKFGDLHMIKEYKNKLLKESNEINLMKGAEYFINYINKNNINHVVVTNTSLENVNYFKSKVQKLNLLKNWITREEYTNPKPSSDCYFVAKNKYYQSEKYTIGIENSIEGLQSLMNITSCIYIMTDILNYNYNQFKKFDVYLINDFHQIFE